MKIVLETERLRLREMTTDDAAFMLALLNEPSFIKNIGDRGVRNLEDAKHYILTGPAASYKQNGFGLYLVEQRYRTHPLACADWLTELRLMMWMLVTPLCPNFGLKGMRLNRPQR